MWPEGNAFAQASNHQPACHPACHPSSQSPAHHTRVYDIMQPPPPAAPACHWLASGPGLAVPNGSTSFSMCVTMASQACVSGTASLYSASSASILALCGVVRAGKGVSAAKTIQFRASRTHLGSNLLQGCLAHVVSAELPLLRSAGRVKNRRIAALFVPLFR